MTDRLSVLEQFFAGIWTDLWRNGGDDLDRFQVLDRMVETGLAHQVPYDPDQHGEIEDAEPGDLIYVRKETTC